MLGTTKAHLKPIAVPIAEATAKLFDTIEVDHLEIQKMREWFKLQGTHIE